MREMLPGTPPFFTEYKEPGAPRRSVRAWWYGLRAERAKWVAVPLRLMLGLGFVVHGAPKLFSMPEHGRFVEMLQELGVPGAATMAWLVGVAELFGGIALLTGTAVWFVSLLLIGEMLVTLFTVHLAHGFGFINVVSQGRQGPVYGMPGVEVNLLYIAGLVALMLLGPTMWSVDKVVEEGQRSRRRPPKA